MVISEKFEFIYIYIDFSYKKLKMEETLSNGLEKLTLNDDDEKVKKIKELEEKVKELEEKIMNEFYDVKVASRDIILIYFITKKLKTLIEVIDEF